MSSKCVKVNGHRVVVGSNRKYVENISEVSHKALLLRSKPGNLGKRKRQDGCESKGGAHLSKSSVKNYSNLMKSGPPERVLFHQNGEWEDFPQEIVELVKEEFKLKKAAIEVRSNGCHFMLDILYMIQVDLKTASQKSIAWIDENGGCFFPEIHSGYEEFVENNEDYVDVEQSGTNEIKLQLEIELNGVNSYGLEECVEESNTDAKKININKKSGRNYPELGSNNEKRIAIEEDAVAKVPKFVTNPNVLETIDIESVRKMFSDGMKTTLDVNIVDINKCYSIMMQTRWEMFQKQAELTQKYRGNTNIRYAWFAAAKDVLSSTMTYGIAHFGSKSDSTYGLGVHLTPVECAVTSADYCDVDENGVRHMVFCRVILGNVEPVPRGSTQFHPSSETFDTGVDDLEYPSRYIVWNMNMNTHIYPEYVVSFNMPRIDKALIAEEKFGPKVTLGQGHPGEGQIGSSGVESGNTPSSGSSTAKKPKSPWMPFSMLFDAISPKVCQDDMFKLYAHYEEMRSKKLNRQEFIMKLRVIVGDELLKTLILGLQSKFPEKAKCVPDLLVRKC